MKFEYIYTVRKYIYIEPKTQNLLFDVVLIKLQLLQDTYCIIHNNLCNIKLPYPITLNLSQLC